MDGKIPWGMIATGEYIYNRDVNGMNYINANLPAPQSAYSGVDARPNWKNGRLNASVVENIVLLNQDVGRSWSLAGSVTKPLAKGFAFKAAYSYSKSRNTIDPGSIAAGSWTGNPIVNDPNNPALALSGFSAGPWFFLSAHTRTHF